METDPTYLFDGSSIISIPTRRKTPLILVFDPESPEFDSGYDAEQLEIHLRNALTTQTWGMLVQMLADRLAAGAMMNAFETFKEQQGDDAPPQRKRRLNEEHDKLDPEP